MQPKHALLVGALALASATPAQAATPPGPQLLDEAATAHAVAIRVDPPEPPPTPDGPDWARCPQWWSEARDAGWEESRLAWVDKIMWRESRCVAGVHNRAGANGLMQVMSMWADDCGMTIAQLREAFTNLLCARHVYSVQGPNAWSTNY